MHDVTKRDATTSPKRFSMSIQIKMTAGEYLLSIGLLIENFKVADKMEILLITVSYSVVTKWRDACSISREISAKFLVVSYCLLQYTRDYKYTRDAHNSFNNFIRA